MSVIKLAIKTKTAIYLLLSSGLLVFTNCSRTYGGMYGLRLEGLPGDRAWSARLKVGHRGLVGVDGRLWGASSRGLAGGWVAVDVATGTPTRVGELPGGSLIYAEQRFYRLTERGTMTLEELTRDGFKTRGSFQLAAGKDVWAHPVVCQGKLFLRYHDTLFCYDVRP